MSWIVDLIIFEHKAIIKSIFWCAVFVAVPLLLWSAAITWSANYEAAHHQLAIPIAPNGIVPSATAAAPVVQAITIDNPALKRNMQFPAVFTRDPDKDPVGAYYADLNFGTGPFPGVYLTDVWQKAGGRIVVIKDWPNIIYYSVFTYKGTSNQVIYDRQHNIVYSIVENPEIMG